MSFATILNVFDGTSECERFSSIMLLGWLTCGTMQCRAVLRAVWMPL